MINRVLASMIASSFTSMATYPLDTLVVSKQFENSVKNYYSGLTWDIMGSCTTTGLFFYTYENCISRHVPVFISSATSTLTSTLINAPFVIKKRDVQKKKNDLFTKKVSYVKKYRNTYLTTVIKKTPKNALKYLIYEKALYVCSGSFSPLFSGALSSFVASLISGIIFYPLDIINIRTSCGIETNLRKVDSKLLSELYKGFKEFIMYSLLCNIIGHSIIEALSPRYTGK